MVDNGFDIEEDVKKGGRWKKKNKKLKKQNERTRRQLRRKKF